MADKFTKQTHATVLATVPKDWTPMSEVVTTVTTDTNVSRVTAVEVLADLERYGKVEAQQVGYPPRLQVRRKGGA